MIFGKVKEDRNIVEALVHFWTMNGKTSEIIVINCGAI